MFSKANLLATLAGFAVLFLGGWVFYDMLAASFYESHMTEAGAAVMREEPNMVMIALGCLVQAFIMSVIYSKWARGIHSAKEGLEYGALIGAFLGFGVWLLNHGVMEHGDTTALIVDGIWSIVHYALVGLVIALVYKQFAQTAS